MSLEDLIEYATSRGLGVQWRPLGRRRGEYRHLGQLIVLNTRLSGLQARCTLAHELGHAHHGDTCSTPELERRANAYAARLLISPTEYQLAERLHGPHAGAIARELGVTRELVEAWQECALRRQASA